MRSILFFSACALLAQAAPVDNTTGPAVPAAPAITDAQLITNETINAIASSIRALGVPGMAVGIITSPDYNQDKTWKQQILTFGVANSAGAPVTADSVFGIGSNSKLFTALSVGMLIEDKTKIDDGTALDWTTKVKCILPEWGLQDQVASEHADIVDVFSFRYGLPGHDLSFPRNSAAKDVVSNMRNLRPSAELRQTFQYGNMPYVVGGEIVSTLSKMSLPDFMQKRIFGPLAMTSATYSAKATPQRTECFTLSGITAEAIAACPNGTGTGCTPKPVSLGWWLDKEDPGFIGATGILLNTRDALKWTQELLSPRVLPAAAIEKCATPAVIRTAGGGGDPVSSYGMAQDIVEQQGLRIVFHGGNIPGQGSFFGRVPALGVGVVAMANDNTYGPVVGQMAATKIVEALAAQAAASAGGGGGGDGGASGGTPAKRSVDLPLARRETPSANTTAPKTQQPTNGFDGIAGNYDSAGYGSMTLAPLSSLSSNVSMLIQGLLAVNGMKTSSPIFVAQVDKLFATHLVLSHWNGDFFNLTMGTYYPHAPGGAVLDPQHGAASAVVAEGGIGLFGVWDGEITKPEVDKDVEANSEVWLWRA